MLAAVTASERVDVVTPSGEVLLTIPRVGQGARHQREAGGQPCRMTAAVAQSAAAPSLA